MSFDLEKLQAVADLGEVIRLQNEALERLQAFRKARPYMVMPNLMKMVEENLKENLQVLYKEFNNLHKPQEQQTRYICNECKMAFVVKLPGGICDECRARLATKPRDYVPYNPPATEEEDQPQESDMIADAQESAEAQSEEVEAIATDAENAAMGDKEQVETEPGEGESSPAAATAAADSEEMSDEFEKFLAKAAGAEPAASGARGETPENQDVSKQTSNEEAPGESAPSGTDESNTSGPEEEGSKNPA